MIKQHIESAWDVILAVFDGVWKLLDNGKIIRRISLFFALYLQYIVTIWAIEYAQTTVSGSLDVAAVIAAVMTPISGFVAAVFKFYKDSRNDPNDNRSG